MTPESHIESAPQIVDRTDGDPGLFGRLVPLISLAVLTGLVVQSCLTQPPSAPAVAPFDAGVAEMRANTAALAALGALPSNAKPELVLSSLNFGAINFATGSSDIPDTAQPLLAAAARALTALPAEIRVQINGHTDNRGRQDANLALSNQRAEAVRAALVALGVPEARLSTRGLGDSKPIASNATEEGRFRNRRIEFALQP